MDGSIEVAAYGNWWFPVAATTLVSIIELHGSRTRIAGLAEASTGALAFLALLFCILYVIQVVCFRNVAIEIAEMMNIELAAASRMHTT